MKSQRQPDMRGKVCLVTGGNSGLGRETAASLAEMGASVVLGCRNSEAAEEAAASIRKLHPEADVIVGPPLDLAQQSSIRSFTEEWERCGRPLHVLVNNAGANFITQRKTAEGVPLQCQVNYFGAYSLTRLLEPTLIASAPSRVVNVSSVTHRYGILSSAASFLSRAAAGRYKDTKLANVLHAYEIQRRLGPLGVQACAVDPGSVSTNVWKGNFSRPPISWVVYNLYAPAADGARAVVHAATTDLSSSSTVEDSGMGSKRKQRRRMQSPRERERAELRFYAKGVFATKAITWYGGPEKGILNKVQFGAWALGAMLLSVADWPVRHLSGGKSVALVILSGTPFTSCYVHSDLFTPYGKFTLCGVSRGRLWSQTRRTPSAPLSYDAHMARALWDQSASIAQLPKDPMLPKQGLRERLTAREA